MFKFDPVILNEMLLNYDTCIQPSDGSTYVWKRREVILMTDGDTEFDFCNPSKLASSWYNRYVTPTRTININPLFSENVVLEVTRFVEWINLNFPIHITHLTLEQSTGEVPVHNDLPTDQVKFCYNKGLEPANIKVLLNPDQYDDTLFFRRFATKGIDEIKWLTKNNLPISTNAYGWSEKFHPHGAIFNQGTNRCIVNVFGILDKREYRRLIDLSLAEYRNYAITFDMDTYEDIL